MRHSSPEDLRGVATDISNELDKLHRLADDIAVVQFEIKQHPIHTRIFYENLAWKLHNFYNGCEGIFRTIVAELNGSEPEGFD